jgi:hypothetical protein
VFFGFDDDQLAFRDAVRDLLDKQCPPEVVRGAWLGDPLDLSVWSALESMGVLSVLVPEGAGGLGLDERSLVLLLEESGRAGLPHPLVDTAVVAAPLGEAAGMVVTDLGGPNVVCAVDADRFLLRDGDALHLVEPDGVSLTPLDTVDGARRAARVAWQPVGATLLTGDPSVVALAFDRGAFGVAAQLVGLGQRMLDLTVAYVGQREQFGQPVGAFQAVKHHLADALKELSFARPAVYRAAHSLAVEAPTRARDVSMAKAMASDAARFVGRQALQCHGAIGYTVEADLHLYMKRAWALASAWGSAAWHRDRVGQALGIS